LANDDIYYRYTDVNVQDAVNRINVIMRDEYSAYEHSLCEERAREVALRAALKEAEEAIKAKEEALRTIKEKDETIKEKDETINNCVRALVRSGHSNEKIASMLMCLISKVEVAINAIHRQDRKRSLQGNDTS
jgi:hypothetical protein